VSSWLFVGGIIAVSAIVEWFRAIYDIETTRERIIRFLSLLFGLSTLVLAIHWYVQLYPEIAIDSNAWRYLVWPTLCLEGAKVTSFPSFLAIALWGAAAVHAAIHAAKLDRYWLGWCCLVLLFPYTVVVLGLRKRLFEAYPDLMTEKVLFVSFSASSLIMATVLPGVLWRAVPLALWLVLAGPPLAKRLMRILRKKAQLLRTSRLLKRVERLRTAKNSGMLATLLGSHAECEAEVISALGHIGDREAAKRLLSFYVFYPGIHHDAEKTLKRIVRKTNDERLAARIKDGIESKRREVEEKERRDAARRAAEEKERERAREAREKREEAERREKESRSYCPRCRKNLAPSKLVSVKFPQSEDDCTQGVIAGSYRCPTCNSQVVDGFGKPVIWHDRE